MDTIEHLRRFGYAVTPGVIPESDCEQMVEYLDAVLDSGSHGGWIDQSQAQTVIQSVHFMNPDLFLKFIDIEAVMEVVSAVLKDDFTLSYFSASLPGPEAGGRIHIDSRVPITDFEETIQIVANLCLTDYSPENGGTVIWPLSHLSGRDPRDMRDEEGGVAPPGRISGSAPRGSVVYLLGQTWHDVGPNPTDERRWGILSYYSRWWLKPTFDFVRGCPPDVYEWLTPRQKCLLGFNTRPPPDPGLRHLTKTPVEDLPTNLEEALKQL